MVNIMDMEILEDQMPLLQEIYMIDKLYNWYVRYPSFNFIIYFVFELQESKFIYDGINFLFF